MALVYEKCHGDLVWKFSCVTIDPKNILDDFKKELLLLCKREWNGKTMKIKVFEDGITNKLVGIYIDGAFDQMVLIRINGDGTENYLRRDLEITCMVMLHKAGVIPPVYCQFENGICYGYQPGKMMTLDEIADLEMARRTARCFAQLHNIPIPINFPKSNRLIEFFGWLDIIKNDFDDERKGKRFKELFGSMDILRKEIAEMKVVIEDLHCPLVFCHNDASSRNLIYNEETDKVTLIDFEYAGPNIRAFDIGNHFSEFAGIDISDMDYSRYPSEVFQKKWIRMYLEEVALLDGKDASSVTGDQVNDLYKQVGKCVLAANLLWTVWCVYQAQFSSIDYTYLELAGIRFGEYVAKKESFLSL